MNKKQSVMAAGILAVLCCLFCSMCVGVLLARYFAASQKRILTEVTAGLVEAYPQADVNQENRNPQSAKSGILQKWVSKTCKPVNSMVL